MKKIMGGVFLLFFSGFFVGPAFAYVISGEIASVDLDVRTMSVKTRNPFTKKVLSQRLTWVVDSPEGVLLRQLKPGDFIRVKADKDGFGRYVVKKIVVQVKTTRDGI